MLANTVMAANYISVCLGRRDGVFMDHPVRIQHCVVNVAGFTEFRIMKHTWPKRDTQKVALERLVKTLGCQPHGCISTPILQTYTWNIDADKTLTLTWKRYVGTFINLRQGLK